MAPAGPAKDGTGGATDSAKTAAGVPSGLTASEKGPPATEKGPPPASVRCKDGQDCRVPEKTVFAMVLLMGLLGGSLRFASSIVKYVGNGQLLRRWVLYYVFMPVEGMGIAVVMYLTVRIGLVAALASSATPTQMNVIGLYAFSVLAGMFSKQALENFGAIFDTIFRRVEGRDPLRDGSSSAPPAPARGAPTVVITAPPGASGGAAGASPPASPPTSPPAAPPASPPAGSKP